MKKTIIHYAAKYRTVTTRVIAVFLILFLLFSTHSWKHESPITDLLDMTGIFLLGICSFGRLWASLYISGYKIHHLMDLGPYSMVRHPLYFFSFIGAVGIGCVSQNIAILMVLVLFFLLYYGPVVLAEEEELLAVHGTDYEQYMKRVPRFIPKFSLLKEPPSFNVQTLVYRKAFLDAIWFVWAFIPLKIIDRLHDAGILQSLFYIP
jgi:protein-S-isoprenylcysteine O-methyltransferase Ste14